MPSRPEASNRGAWSRFDLAKLWRRNGPSRWLGPGMEMAERTWALRDARPGLAVRLLNGPFLRLREADGGGGEFGVCCVPRGLCTLAGGRRVRPVGQRH